MVLAVELYVNLNVIERLSHVYFKKEVPDYLPMCFVHCLCRCYIWAGFLETLQICQAVDLLQKAWKKILPALHARNIGTEAAS
jgi:hypothetical protein